MDIGSIVTSQTANIALFIVFALLAAGMTGFSVWGYRWRARGVGEWWTPLIQVVADAFFMLHFLLLSCQSPSGQAHSPQSSLVEETFWFGFAGLWCWGTISVGLWLRTKRRNRAR